MRTDWREGELPVVLDAIEIGRIAVDRLFA
jgi:hypothetical protein